MRDRVALPEDDPPIVTAAQTRQSGVVDVSDTGNTFDASLVDILTEEAKSKDGQPWSVGRFRVLEKIGSGGMGVVFAAYDDQLDRKIAIKLVLSSKGGEQARERLLEEAKAMARLDHPNVATVHEIGEHEDGIYVAMEFIRGITLRKWLGDQRSLESVLDAFVQAGRGLEAAHAAKLVHRDFKPDNAMIDDASRVRVLDFGLAVRQLEVPNDSGSERQKVVVDPRRPQLTRVGGLVGTPAYMAPEVFAGARCDEFGDQFSYCTALWEALHGERPFTGDALVELAAGADIRPASPRAEHARFRVPSWLDAIVRRGLALDPAARYPSMRELLAAIEAGDPAIGRRRLVVVGIAAAVLVAVVASALAIQRATRTSAIAACSDEGALALSETDARTIEGIFTESPEPDARQQLREALAGLRDHEQGWSEAWGVRCEASVDGTMQPELAQRRDLCFALARGRYDATVSVLRRANEQVIRRAGKQARGLPPPSRCNDPEHLRAMVVPTAGDASADELLALQLGLVSNLVPEDLGHWEEGLAEARALLDEAQRLDQMGLAAEAQYRVGVFEDKLGRIDDAERDWVAAYKGAAISGTDHLAADAAVSLAFIHGVRRHDARTGNAWIEVAEVYLERGETDHHQTRANYYQAKAIVLEELDRREEALAVHEEGLAFAIERGGPMDRSVGFALVNHAALLQDLGRLAEARDEVKRGVEVFERNFGMNNPSTAEVVRILANLHRRLGEHEASKAQFARARAIFETRPLEETRGSLAKLLRDEATLFEDMKMPDDAIADLRRVVELAEGPPDEFVLDRRDLAFALLRHGHTDEGIAELERTLADPVHADAEQRSKLKTAVEKFLSESALDPDLAARVRAVTFGSARR